jgi:hypothetical protein
MPKVYVGEKAAFSTNVGQSKYPHAEDWN